MPSATPSLLNASLGRLLEAVLARITALDPEFAMRLAPLEGRRLSLHLSAPAVGMSVTVREGRFVIGPAETDQVSDLSVRASPGALLAQLLPSREGTSAPGRITISGDAELARRLQQLVQRFDPDVEEAFTRVFGDVLGVQLARALHQGLDWSRRTAGGLAQDTAEFLTEETRALVAKAELSAFHDDVDALRDDVERTERRIARLQARQQRG